MSNCEIVSLKNSIDKTRNAILRMKNCSPKLKMVLRQRCQERIQSERSKIINKLRKIPSNSSFRETFDNIICGEWENIEKTELYEPSLNSVDNNKFENVIVDLDEELKLEELIEKELKLEELLAKELLKKYEDWLVQQCEELLTEEIENDNHVVCPLCCSGYLKSCIYIEPKILRVKCSKCLETFTIDHRYLGDFKKVIYECLSKHNEQCYSNASFINVPKNENESSLCIICDKCSFLSPVE